MLGLRILAATLVKKGQGFFPSKTGCGELRMNTIYFAVASLALGAGVVTYQSSGAGEDCYMAADFDAGQQNQLGGYLNAYKAGPSSAKVKYATAKRRGASGRSLCISADRKTEGFCGTWMHFFDMHTPNHKYFDAGSYRCLSFWVKGEAGGEEFSVKLADKKWIAKEDSVALGPIAEFLPGGVTTEWQEARVPLHTDNGLDWHQLGGLTFDFDKPGSHTVYVDDVTFKFDPTASAPVQATVRNAEEKPAVAAPETAVIIRPASGARVSRREDLDVEVPPGKHAVVLVRCAEPHNLWWVQEEVQRSAEDRIKAKVRFGNDNTPAGTKFLVAVILPPTAEAAGQFRIGNTMKTLPSGIPQSKLLQVVSN